MDIKKIIASIIWRRDCIIYPEEIFYENNTIESMSFDEELNCNVLRDISNNEINICESNNKKNNFEKEKEKEKRRFKS